MIKKILVTVLAVLWLYPAVANAQTDDKEYSKQDRTCIYYVPPLEEVSFLYFTYWDIRYRMSNYSDASDYFSFTGKIGLQGLAFYLHIGPEIKLSNSIYINSTVGIIAGLFWVGIINETELGMRLNISKQLFTEGSVSLLVFPYNLFNLDFFVEPQLKIGLGLDL